MYVFPAAHSLLLLSFSIIHEILPSNPFIYRESEFELRILLEKWKL